MNIQPISIYYNVLKDETTIFYKILNKKWVEKSISFKGKYYGEKTEYEVKMFIEKCLKQNGITKIK